MGKPVIFVNAECLRPEYGSVDSDYFTAMSKIASHRSNRFNGVFGGLRLFSGGDRNSTEVIADQLGITDSWHVIAGGSYFFNSTTREIKPHPAINKKVKREFRKILRWKVPRILRRYQVLEYCPGEDVCLALEIKKTGSLLSTEKMLPVIKETYLRDLRKNKTVLVTYSRNAIFIVPWIVTFFSAVKFLAGFDDIDLSKSLAIGASKADVSLFRCVGRIGCPSNALPECREAVKQRRGKTSLKPCASGVLDIIEWYMGLQN